MTMCVIDLIMESLDSNNDMKEVLNRVLKYFLLGLLGIILYFIGTKISLIITQSSLSTYKGANEMGKIPIDQIPFLLKRTYTNFIGFFLGNSFLKKYKI